jgi:sec-independent protein translocase protein TatA
LTRTGPGNPTELNLTDSLVEAPSLALESNRRPTMPFAIFQHIGGYEILIIGFVSLLIFGNRLPSVMRSLGKSVTEFKKGVAGIEDEIDKSVTADKKDNPTTPV